jgi:ubiquinone/menaquinone biosynthesis C-methylase UbiE
VDLIQNGLPFAGETFDSITLMHMMEHLPQFGKAPVELFRILKPGGRLYIEGPGPRSLFFPSSLKTVTLRPRRTKRTESCSTNVSRPE